MAHSLHSWPSLKQEGLVERSAHILEVRKQGKRGASEMYMLPGHMSNDLGLLTRIHFLIAHLATVHLWSSPLPKALPVGVWDCEGHQNMSHNRSKDFLWPGH